MILFSSDWLEYPSAIVDYTTKNTSFKRVASLFKEIGVENNTFMLSLMQPELQGVNPHDPELNREMKFKIAQECQWNPWYYFREIVAFRPPAGTVSIPFEATRANISMLWCFFNHMDYMLIQPRQTHKSGSSDCLILGLLHLWCSNTSINLITKDDALRRSNIERLKGLRESLPEYLYYPDRTDASNSETLTVNRRANRLMTAVAQASETGADKLGRGLTTPITVIDEFAYINNIDISLPVALAAGSEARRIADRANAPYGNLFLTTAGNTDKGPGVFAHKQMIDGTEWNDHFYDSINLEDFQDRVKKAAGRANRQFVVGVFNHLQLGYTDEWMMKTLRDANSEGEVADRDYFNVWTSTSEGSVLTQEDRERCRKGEIPPLYTEISSTNYTLNWYIDKEDIDREMNSASFVVGLDTSEALGGDNDAIGLTIFNVKTHELVAAGRYNQTNTMSFANFIADLLVKYPRLTLIFERRSTGIAILDAIILRLVKFGIDPFRRIFNRIVDEHLTLTREWEEISKPMARRDPIHLERYKRYFGYATSGTGKHSRDNLYHDALHSMIKHGAHRLHSTLLIQEIVSLEIRNGRIDHSKSGHDDLVISSLLAHWLCTRGKNLQHYGIQSREIFSDVEDLTDVTPEERLEMDEKKKFKKEVDDIFELLKLARNQYETSELERRLRFLSSRRDMEETVGVGIDAMIEQARDERRAAKHMPDSEYRRTPQLSRPQIQRRAGLYYI